MPSNAERDAAGDRRRRPRSKRSSKRCCWPPSCRCRSSSCTACSAPSCGVGKKEIREALERAGRSARGPRRRAARKSPAVTASRCAPEYAEWVSKLWQEKPPRLSRALLETLAHHLLPPADHARRDRGDPRRGAVAQHHPHAARARLDPRGRRQGSAGPARAVRHHAAVPRRSEPEIARRAAVAARDQGPGSSSRPRWRELGEQLPMAAQAHEPAEEAPQTDAGSRTQRADAKRRCIERAHPEGPRHRRRRLAPRDRAD